PCGGGLGRGVNLKHGARDIPSPPLPRKGGESRSSERRCSYPLLSGALGGLGKLLQHAVALELRQIVDEQHTVEMVDLMLDTGGIKPFGLFLMHLAVKVGK